MQRDGITDSEIDGAVVLTTRVGNRGELHHTSTWKMGKWDGGGGGHVTKLGKMGKALRHGLKLAVTAVVAVEAVSHAG